MEFNLTADKNLSSRMLGWLRQTYGRRNHRLRKPPASLGDRRPCLEGLKEG